MLSNTPLSHSQNIDISAEVPIRQIQFKVFPEKRLPSINNWSTIVDVELRSCSTNQTVHRFQQITTNNAGIGTINVSNLSVRGDNYTAVIRGASHLNKKFSCYHFNNQNVFMDLTTGNSTLLAGEISNKYDNYINALDISVLIKNFYSSDYYSDLNQDGKVNSLDSSIQLINLYKNGDN